MFNRRNAPKVADLFSAEVTYEKYPESGSRVGLLEAIQIVFFCTHTFIFSFEYKCMPFKVDFDLQSRHNARLLSIRNKR